MFKDSIVQKFSEDGHEFTLTHYFDTTLCYEQIKTEAEAYWETKGKKDAEANYLFDNETSWSLGQMLKNQGFELGFTVVEMDGTFLAAAGLRRHDDVETICLSRFFGIPSLYPYGNAFILPLHIKLSKENGYKSTIITFNPYNEHLLNYYTRILPRKTDKVSLMVYEEIKNFKSLGLQTINHTEQFVLAYSF
nr:hypothetical protein BHI3_35360 [Bacteriovorax sp. HI3]